jgi:DNA-binding transcriptional ArsR family regulator
MAVELRSNVFASAAHELVCHIVTFVGKQTNLEIGDRWFVRARAAMSPELLKALAVLDVGHDMHVPGSGLLNLIYARRWATVDEFLNGLESEPENDLLLFVADIDEFPVARDQMADWVLRTAAGQKIAAPTLADPDAHAQKSVKAMAQWLPRLKPRLHESLIDIARLWRRDLFGAEEERLTAILQRDAQAKQELSARLGPADLMEEATNGVVWVDQPGVDLLALMPTWIMRPWTLHHRTGSTAVISYPVADESLGGNGGALAARTVKLARVLSDESRVRAIQLLAAEPLSLQELAGKLGLRKSTVHHHIAELKAVGLLRVPMGTKTYSLRPEVLDRYGSLLSALAKPAREPSRKKR